MKNILGMILLPFALILIVIGLIVLQGKTVYKIARRR